LIRHFCDGCDREVKTYATISISPKWLKPVAWGNFKYVLCDDCYSRLGMLIDVPENTSDVKE
jgi:hypothetical protein